VIKTRSEGDRSIPHTYRALSALQSKTLLPCMLWKRLQRRESQHSVNGRRHARSRGYTGGISASSRRFNRDETTHSPPRNV
jgi:hypothetical protein